MNLAKLAERLSPTTQAFVTLTAVFSIGMFSGSTLSGLTTIPEIARISQAANVRQDSQIDSLRTRDLAIDDRITRLACLMTAQFEGTNPIRCDKEAQK